MRVRLLMIMISMAAFIFNVDAQRIRSERNGRANVVRTSNRGVDNPNRINRRDNGNGRKLGHDKSRGNNGRFGRDNGRDNGNGRKLGHFKNRDNRGNGNGRKLGHLKNRNNRGRFVREDRRGYYDYDFRNNRRVYVRRGIQPSSRHIWVSGHWRYDARFGREVWINGRWTLRRGYHQWRAGYYGLIGGSYGWINGGWIRVY